MNATTITKGRISSKLEQTKQEGRCALVTFLTAYDPNPELSLKMLKGLPNAGADLIEIGVPFSDPMADGPTIQAAGERAIASGATVANVLSLVKDFRNEDDTTPIILMTYLNPVEAFGVDEFFRQGGSAGVDGVIVIDMPTDDDSDFSALAEKYGIDIIRLATPTTDDKRLAVILERSMGFLYYVSLKGVTGVDGLAELEVRRRVLEIKRQTNLPIAVGFGVRTPEQAASIAKTADAVVVGSALIEQIALHLEDPDKDNQIARAVWRLVQNIASKVRSAR
jgi:tryptophan synthase alpha chain